MLQRDLETRVCYTKSLSLGNKVKEIRKRPTKNTASDDLHLKVREQLKFPHTGQQSYKVKNFINSIFCLINNVCAIVIISSIQRSSFAKQIFSSRVNQK